MQVLAGMGGDPYTRAQAMTQPKDVEGNATVMAARMNLRAVRRTVLREQPEGVRAGRFSLMSTLLSNRAAAWLELNKPQARVNRSAE